MLPFTCFILREIIVHGVEWIYNCSMHAMTGLTLQTFTPECLEAVEELQRAYARKFPGAKVIPGELYLSPAFRGGQDVFCAFSNGKLVAYAPCYIQFNEGPAGLPHRIWVENKTHPGLADPIAVKDQLMEHLFQCALQRLAQANPHAQPRTAHMIFEYLTTETDAIAYATSRGFAYSESVFTMSRDLMHLPLPAVPPTAAPITLRRWKMETEAEQQAYVDARNQCFPESPLRLEEWQFFMQSPMWPDATIVAAFSGDRLAGCTSVYWNAEENQRSGVQAGFTEDIFVLASFRGHGVAQAMIANGLEYLRDHGLCEAHLMVRALNENALGLYRKLGYRTTGESRFYSRAIEEDIDKP